MRTHRLNLIASSDFVVIACSSAGTGGSAATGAGNASGTGNGSGTSNGSAGGTTASGTGGVGALTGTSSGAGASGSSGGTGGTPTSGLLGRHRRHGGDRLLGRHGGHGDRVVGGTGGAATTGSSGGTGGLAATGSASSSSGGTVTFGGACNLVPTVLTGVVFAPNGADPIPNVRVYAAISINPYPASYCDKCAAPIDPAYVSTTTAADGSFSLNIDDVPQGATIDFAIQIGRFRKHTNLPVTACQSQVVPVAARTLPGNSAAGDIPKIAVSAGNADHLDSVLHTLGITEYDCFEGRKGAPDSSTSTCPLTANSKFIADVLQDGTINNYHMAFLSCAPDAYAWAITPLPVPPSTTGGHGNNQSLMTANTATWVAGGGRIFVTDTAYDYIAQPFPAGITWAGPAGTPQPVDGANIGCSPPNNTTGPTTLYPINIDDPILTAWLKLVGFPSSPSVSIDGFYNPWSTIASVAPTSTLIADGTMPLDLTTSGSKCATSHTLTMQNVPLTAQFDVPTCGRVIFSSYHTYSGMNATAANEKIMEFLIFDAASCQTH